MTRLSPHPIQVQPLRPGDRVGWVAEGSGRIIEGVVGRADAKNVRVDFVPPPGWRWFDLRTDGAYRLAGSGAKGPALRRLLDDHTAEDARADVTTGPQHDPRDPQRMENEP